MASAEESIFGSETVELEYGVTSSVVTWEQSSLEDLTIGCAFTPKENVTLYGARSPKMAPMNVAPIKLWGPDKTVLATIDSVPTTQVKNPTDYYFDSPIPLVAGEKYVLSRFIDNVHYYNMKVQYVTVNNKMTLTPVYANGDVYPENSETYFKGFDPIIGPVSLDDRPAEYSVQRSSMDGIADEVKRITGTTDRMSVEQIVTALKGVAVQTATTEE
jgi:hypothetical protein